jgi:DNA-directed RNA polymerase specialized sigma24 family protein
MELFLKSGHAGDLNIPDIRIMHENDRYNVLRESSDFNLLKETSCGNACAFEFLMDRYLDIVSSTSFRIMCDRENSEYVTEEVFVSVWNEALDYDDSYTVKEWILRKTCSLCMKRIYRRMLLRIFGVQTDVFVQASPEVDDVDGYLTKLAWELYCRATTHMSPLQCISYALCSMEDIPVPEASYIVRRPVFMISMAHESAKEKVINELVHYGREADYDRYLRFLRRVAESLTDRSRLISNISRRVGFFSN